MLAAKRIEPLPQGASVSETPGGQFDVVQLSMRSQAEIDARAGDALAALKPGGLLWVAFRDAGRQLLSLASIDDTWSEGRLRPAR